MNQSQSQSQTTSAPEAAAMPATERLAAWLEGYVGPSGLYDELLAADGTLRPPWAKIFEELSKRNPSDFEQRWAEARELIHENGVTYNIYGEEDGYQRPWELDPLPMVISAEDWAGLESALVQRAGLLESVLTDLYGERKLLEESLLPPELVFGNPRFLRAAADLPSWGSSPLPFYAADVARSPDGRWWVVSDRTQAPSGMGYALENRIVLGRMMPAVARECGLERLVGFFDTLRATLAAAAPRAAAPRAVAQPHVVLLSAGPRDEFYFEHAFMARYLGITLAEADDLTVRDSTVYLKTLDGLREVDVIWRRIDENLSDPLELRSSSGMGVSGLLQAMRAGKVTVLNPPGSGLIESPALMAFLPALAERLLGEPLQIPSVATWWCGGDESREMALSKLSDLVVKHAFDKAPPLGINDPTDEEARHAIESDPASHVAQEKLPYSTAPVWTEHGMNPRQVVLRVFLVKTENGYVAMPGGLARVADDARDDVGHAIGNGSGSKDTWVLSGAHRQHITALAPTFPVVIKRGAGQFPSRVADNLYWIGRNAERSEFTARLLRGIIAQVGSESGFSALTAVAPAWDELVANEQLGARPVAEEPADDDINLLEGALKAAVFDATSPGSLRALNTRLRRLGEISRDTLSADTWTVVSHIGQRLRRRQPPNRLIDCLGVLDEIVNLHAALSGLAQENFTRTPAWAFLDIGRRIERATYAAGLGLRLLKSPDRDNRAVLEALLDMFDSSITYRGRYYFEPRLLQVVDTILLDPSNPRSLAFQMAELDNHLAGLPNELAEPGSTRGRQLAASGLRTLWEIDLSAADNTEKLAIEGRTTALLEALLTDLADISTDLTGQYFSLLAPEQLSAENLSP